MATAPPEDDRPGDPPGGPDRDRPQPLGLAPRGRDDFEALKTKDPELFKAIQQDFDLERQTRDQAEQYRRAGKDDQAGSRRSWSRSSTSISRYASSCGTSK